MEQEGETGSAAVNRTTGLIRVAIGLLQGLAAWWLLELVPPILPDKSIQKASYWSHQHPLLFAGLAIIIAFVPVIALLEAGRLRSRRLLAYLMTATALLAALAAYDIWHDPVDWTWSGNSARIWPSAGFVFCAGLGAFIVNQLIEHRERGHPLFVHYAAHFEDSWMRGFQLVISLIFTLLIWGTLKLGESLFDLIHVEWFGRMIAYNWFRCPILACAFAASVHITDVRPALLIGVRNLGLTLLSWILPLIVCLGSAFLMALLFTGLKPLWETRFAASILLTSSAVTLVLINAAYKDGDPDHLPAAPVRWLSRAAGPMMLALTILATYAIALRVWQHGWTPQRIEAAAVAFVGLVYGIGYSWASIDRGQWLKRLERVNVTASFVILGVLILLFTPIADPARLAVNSQVSRLDAGEITPGKFDYQFLRFDSGRYGADALDTLTHSRDPDIANRAKLTLQKGTRSYWDDADTDSAKSEPAFSHATAYPRGVALPPDFKSTKFTKDVIFTPACLTNGSACEIIIWETRRQSLPLLLVYGPEKGSATTSRETSVPVYARDLTGRWGRIGSFDHIDCPGVLDALRKGQGTAIRPAYDDLQVDGIRLNFSPDSRSADTTCPKAEPVPRAEKPRVARAPSQMGPAFGNAGPM